MDNETIVNRTPETWGLRQEAGKIDGDVFGDTKQFGDTIPAENAVTTVENSVTTVLQDRESKTGKVEIFPDSELVKAKKLEAQEAGIEQPDSDPVYPDPNEELIRAGRELLAHVIRDPRDPDLKEFKKQVVAAFKHLGLDTNKFFGA